MKFRNTASLIAAPIAAFALVATGTTSAGATAATTYCPSFGAHRGEGWPTVNTGDGVNAIQAAIDDTGAAFVESDVWATQDGLGVMQHSDNLKESTDSAGRVADFTLESIQTTVHMNDGTTPESLPQFLTQVVAAHKHAILHDKAASLDAYIDAQMRATHARTYVRVMVASVAEAKWFHDKGWIVEYTPPARMPTSSEITKAKAAGVTSVLIVDTSRKATPANRFQPWIAAHIETDYVTYSAAQDGIVTRYKLGRVLSGDLAQSRLITKCK